MRAFLSILTILFCIIGGKTLLAQDDAKSEASSPEDDPVDILAGHSEHGMAFNEGPRQKAYIMKGMPDVHFTVSTKVPDCQKFFNQGIGQLHGFWYLEAERSFRQAAMFDPECAMAYWGMARSVLGSEERSKGFIEEAVKRKGSASPLESRHIDALAKYIKTPKEKKKERSEAYTRDLENILLDHPKDLETRALLALQHWKNSRNGIKIQSHIAVDAVLQQVFQESPMHPAHHFRIHLWDYKKAAQALDSAAICGQTGPGIAHLWHMSGHIYSKVKRYHDACYQQEASARTDHAYMMRDRVMPDQIHNFAHNNEWLCRSLLNVGRVGESVDLARNMLSLPRHPEYNSLGKKKGSSHHGRRRILGAVEQFELWDLLLKMHQNGEIEATEDEADQRRLLHLLGIANFKSGNTSEGLDIIAQFEKRATPKVKPLEKKELPKDADKKAKDDAAKKASEHKKKIDSDKRRISDVNKKLDELRLLNFVQSGNKDEAKKQLAKAKSMDRTRKAFIQIDLGMNSDAIKTAESMSSGEATTVLPLARAAHIFELAGKKGDAEKALKKLRKNSEALDLNSPVFARLAPIAKRLKMPNDWRIQQDSISKVANRPSLDSLGPFRWKPLPASNWKLSAYNGKMHSLSDYKGRPLILIFYLGFGCLHCVEQLHAFSPQLDEFRKTGIEILAVSTETVCELEQGLAEYRKDGKDVNFPLLSDETLKVFKAYRAYDDFENMPLHGTFLIDESGHVRWQDIGHEPFTEVDFLLREARRLLDMTSSRPALSAK